MNKRSYLEQYKSIATRINYIQNRLTLMSNEETYKAWDALAEAEKELQKLFGEKISWEISCKVGER